MQNISKLPSLENFKQEAINLKNTQKFSSLGHAQNALAKSYGFCDYNAIKPQLIEINYILNRLPKKIKIYTLLNGSLVNNSGLYKTKDGYKTDAYHSEKSYINKIEIEKALLFIDDILEKRKTINHKGGTSYSLKHYAEAYFKHYDIFDNYYISNGAFIVALDIRNYTIYEELEGYIYNLNVYTNYKKLGDFYTRLEKGDFDYTLKK